MSKKKVSKIIYVVLLVLFSLCFVISGFFVVKHYVEMKHQDTFYESLEKEIKIPVQQTPTIEGEAPKSQFLIDYEALKEKNEDSVGWISIDGTLLDYPVVQTPDRPNYYLRRAFDKTDSRYGCPYVQENCDLTKPSDNIIVYGHNMNNDRMFGVLDKYLNRAFFLENRYINFNIMGEQHVYEVMSVFTISAIDVKSFDYHVFVDLQTEEWFNNFVELCNKNALYYTGVTAQYGDKFLTLSTCEYTKKEGRLVVIAKEVK